MTSLRAWLKKALVELEELEANVTTDEDNDDANSRTRAKPDAAADVYISTKARLLLMCMLKQMLLLMPMLMLGDAANERAIRATRAREQGGPKNSHP